jgi:RNA polymerase primary sigma factor
MDELLRRYLAEAADQPLLTKDEERALGREAASGSKAAKDTLVRCNLRLVVALARRYEATGVPLLDLIQEGNLGLVRAVEAFDPDRGFVFSTFATWWIRQALGSMVRGAGVPDGGDDGDAAMLGGVQEAWDAFVADHGRQPTLAELATATGIDEDELTDLLGRPPG